jgi:hypothetical protein
VPAAFAATIVKFSTSVAAVIADPCTPTVVGLSIVVVFDADCDQPVAAS